MDGQAEAAMGSAGWHAPSRRSVPVDTIAATLIAVVMAIAVTSALLAVTGGPALVPGLGAEGAAAIVAVLARVQVSPDRARLEQAARTGAELAAQGYPVAWNAPTSAWRIDAPT